MRSIYKYTLQINEDTLGLDAPITKFLSVQVQKGAIRIWAEVDTDMPDRHFAFCPVGTGWDIGQIHWFDKMTYLDTVQEFGGDLVWHIYYLELTESFYDITKKGQK